MKRIFSMALCLLMVVAFSSCKGIGDNGGNKNGLDPTDPSIYTLDVVGAMQAGKPLGLLEERKEPEEVSKAADELLKKIEEFSDTLKAKEGANTYYVSNDGDDGNDGLSPEKPLKTIHAATLKSKSGDVVLLNRGDFWREYIVCREGVSYGAYGKGNKPTLYGSIDGLSLEWEKDEENENIWKVDVGTSADIGLIVFDHGKAVANCKESKEKLIQDYNFYYDTRKTEVYLYLSAGNPTELFGSIELCPDVKIVTTATGSTIQNLRLMYSGSFAVGVYKADQVKIQGCIMGYIGGSIMSGTTRYGNAVELQGNGDGFYIDYCHVYQCYDAGITFQWTGAGGQTREVTEQNIAFTNNLVEYCVYNLEYFLHNSSGMLKNIEISNNIMRYAGYGWGTLARSNKSTPAAVKGGVTVATVENFVIKNNIFSHGYPTLIAIGAETPDRSPVLSGNTYIVNKNRKLFVGEKTSYEAKNCVGKTAKEIFGDETGEIIIY